MSSGNNTNYPRQFDYLSYPNDRAYYKALERERRKEEKKYSGSRELPSLIYDYKPPFYVDNVEAYSLFHFLITGEPTQDQYLNPRHKWIHMAIEGMYESGWADNMGTDQLIHYLHEQDWIGRVGGETYIKNLFKNLDVQSVLYRRDY